ncbi:MAG: hypothetical protein GWN86_31340 [Desulfobacterales bacterium]|nr:hypothetical protein [Desulfobacterales bacterium]
MECPQCKLRYAAYLPSIRVELITPDADPMSAERILHDLTGTRLSAYGEPLGEEGPNVVRSE